MAISRYLFSHIPLLMRSLTLCTLVKFYDVMSSSVFFSEIFSFYFLKKIFLVIHVLSECVNQLDSDQARHFWDQTVCKAYLQSSLACKELIL